MGRLDILLDNPILVKFLRTRLRRAQLMPWLVLIVVLCLAIVWAAQAWDLLVSGSALTFLMGLQIITLIFVGAAQVGAAVGGVRESGIIDFHRIAPLPPSWLAVGFFLGGPCREYVLFAATLPFAFLLAVASETPGVLGWLELTVPLVSTAWVLHAFAMLSGLLTRRPRGAGKGAGAGFVVLAIFLCQPIGYGLWSAVRSLNGSEGRIAFFGLPVPWLLFVLLYQASILAFVFLAASRRFRSDATHPLSKPQAVGGMALITALVLGAAWNFQGKPEIVLVVLDLLVLVSLFLAGNMTVTQFEYVRAVRRALREGRHRPRSWEDDGVSRLALAAICALVFLGATASWELIAGSAQSHPGQYSQTIAIGVFVTAYFGLGLQYFQLRLAKSGGSIMALFLFLVWLLPILVGSLAFGASGATWFSSAILCLSPLTGIVMSSGVIETSVGKENYCKLFALLPAIGFAALFNFLLVAVQRKIDLSIRSGVPVRAKPDPFDDVLGPIDVAKAAS